MRHPVIYLAKTFFPVNCILEALGSRIGTGLVFRLSFSVSNTVSNLWYKLIPFTTSIPLPTSNSYYRLSYVSIHWWLLTKAGTFFLLFFLLSPHLFYSMEGHYIVSNFGMYVVDEGCYICMVKSLCILFTIECPRLWRITINSLHNEGIYKWVNSTQIFFW